ncbi:MAG: MFS transporter, partial [Anaerolineales bacterium]|nr:MFS transporter [Anaerolineales bacterium]
MKNSTIYLTGTGISSFGDGIHMVALSLALLDSTNSALAIGLMIATYYVPVFLLSPFAGVFCDNRDAKRIVVLTELSRFLLILGMAYMIHFHNDVILPLYLLQALLATARVLFKPASRTVIREAFDMNGCVKTFSLGSTIGLITTIVGSGLGGWLITNQPAVLCFIINALTYLVSAIAYTLLERLFRAELPATSGAYWPQIKAACRFVSLQPGMLSILVFSMIGSASYRLVITILPIYVARDLGGDNNLFTLMNVAFIAGGAAGGICVWRLLKTFGQWTAVVTFAGIAFFSLLLGLLDQTGLLMVALFGMGFVTIALLS